MAIKYEVFSKQALIKLCYQLDEDVDRKQDTIDEMLNRRVARDEKVSVTPQKERGKLDRHSWKFIFIQFMHSIGSNLITVPLTAMGAAQYGQFTWWIVWMGVASAVMLPLQTLFQKLGETHK